MPREKIKLDPFQRNLLSNQLRILEALYPDEANDMAIRREALERGYEMLYGWDMDHIYVGEDVTTVEESKEVWDTLDMFDAIYRSAEGIGKLELLEKPFAKFHGYDGNNESKLMAFAAYTVERLKRFEYIQMPRKGYWNSHMPVRHIYRRMLEVWREIPRGRQFELSEKELNEILSAATPSENQQDG